MLQIPHLELVGMHAHIGSQIFDTAGFRLAAHRMVGLLAAVRDELGDELAELDLGGGLGIAYTSEDAPLEVAEVATRLREIVEKECATAGLAVPRVCVEPGRAISGPGTITVYEVGTVKELPGLRTFVSVDGGMSDNIRTALYDAHYTAALASETSDGAPARRDGGGQALREWRRGGARRAAAVRPDARGPARRCRRAAPITGRWPTTTTTCRDRQSWPCATATARVIVRRETEDDLLRLDGERARGVG